MIATRQYILDGGYTNIGAWIDLAKRAEAVGLNRPGFDAASFFVKDEAYVEALPGRAT